MLDREPHPGHAVRDHRRHVESIDRAVDEHDGQPLRPQRREMARAMMRRRKNHAVDTALEQHLDDEALLFLGLAGVADDERVAVALGFVLRPHRQPGPEGIGEIANGEAERIGAVALEIAGERARPVAELAGGVMDAARRSGADAELAAASAQHMRHGSLRDAHAVGDVLHAYGQNVKTPKLNRITYY